MAGAAVAVVGMVTVMTTSHFKLKGPSRNFLLLIEKDVLEGLKALAEQRSVSVSQVMRDVLREHLIVSHDEEPLPSNSEKAWWI